MAKMKNKFIVMCSVAIGAVYTSGYIVTKPQPTQASTDSSADHGMEAHRYQQSASAINTQTMPSNMSTTTKPAKQGKYKTGTYTGVGTNDFGSVQVAIKVGPNKIQSVKITKCTTSFPQSNIDTLPAKIVASQNIQVDNISGATATTDDFKQAVEMAMEKAKA